MSNLDGGSRARQQRELDREQTLLDLDQSIAEREQARADRGQLARSVLGAASEDLGAVEHRRVRPGRWLQRNAWAPLGAVAIMVVLLATTQVVLSVAAHKDDLRQAQIAIAAAGQTEFGLMHAPIGLIGGERANAGEYTLSATLRARLAGQMTALTRFWPTQEARQTSADAHSLTTRIVALMDLIQQHRLRAAGALYQHPIAPISDAFNSKLALAQKRLRADANAADTRAARAAVSADAAAGLLLVLLFLGVAVMRRRLDRADIEQQVLGVLATTDSLTGVSNHRALILATRTEVERALRYERPFAVLFLDIDHFKQINDLYGHAAGDMTLATFARFVADTLRSSDSFGRWGGEEFVAVLPETDQATAVDTAERVRVAVAEHPFPAIGARHLTCSIGVAICPDNETEFTALIAAADRAMYQAKANGRDQCITASNQCITQRPAGFFPWPRCSG